jgi:flagellar FliJ protein
MAYHFRLEALLRVRRRLKEAAEAELARATGVLKEARDKEEMLAGQLREAKQDLSGRITEGMVAKEYQWRQEQVSALEERFEKAFQARVAAEQEVEQLRARLAQRHRDVELIEKFRERDYQEYLREIMRQEQIEADDMASIRFVMNRVEKEAINEKQHS